MDAAQMTAWANSDDGQKALQLAVSTWAKGADGVGQIRTAVWAYPLKYVTGAVPAGTELAQLRYKIAAAKVDVHALVLELAPAIAAALPPGVDEAMVAGALRGVFADAATPT